MYFKSAGQTRRAPITCGCLARAAGLLVATIMMLALGRESLAADMLIIEGPGVRVFYPTQALDTARAVLEEYPSSRDEVERALGLKADFTADVVLMTDRAAFRGAAGSGLIVAFAQPGRGVIVADASRMALKPFTLEGTLRHELCHLVIGRHIESAPKWLDEGICQHISGGPSEVLYPSRKYLPEAVFFKKLIPIGRLARGFPGDDKLMLLAYEESESFIEYIADKYGEGAIRELLRIMAGGTPVERALKEALKASIEELEPRWQANLGRRHTLVFLISRNVYEIIFFLAALAALAAYLRAAARRKKYRQDEEDAEAEDEGDKPY